MVFVWRVKVGESSNEHTKYMDYQKYKIIKDYLFGKATEKETVKLAEWMSQSEEFRTKFFRTEAAYYLGRISNQDSQKITKISEERLFKEINQIDHDVKRIRLFKLMRYAAIIAITVLVGSAGIHYLYKSMNIVTVAAVDHIQEIALPDKSKVWLNKGASIKYPKVFADDERKVEIEGEALFKVTKNPERPFIVNSRGASVRVLGTTFNFNEYGKNNSEEISLIEGRLQVTGRHGEGTVYLNPNQKATINKVEKTIHLENVYAPVETVWRDNIIPFQNMELSQIANILGQLYGYEVTIDPKLKNGKTYSGVLKRSKDVRTVLEGLSYTISFHYKITDGNITLMP